VLLFAEPTSLTLLLFTTGVRLTIYCIFCVTVVRSYNSLLEMSVLQNSLNFNYSPCLSHWTAVRSSSKEISVTFTEYIRLWLVPSYGWKDTNYLKIHVEEMLENFHWFVFRNLWLLSFETSWFLGINLSTLILLMWRIGWVHNNARK